MDGFQKFTVLLMGIIIVGMFWVVVWWRKIKNNPEQYTNRYIKVLMGIGFFLVIALLYLVNNFVEYQGVLEYKNSRFQEFYDSGCANMNSQKYDLAIEEFRIAERNETFEGKKAHTMLLKAAYMAGIANLSSHEYKKAESNFCNFAIPLTSKITFPENIDDEFKDVKFLYYYAVAQQVLLNGIDGTTTSWDSRYGVARSYLDYIPSEYNGAFKDEISELRRKIIAEQETRKMQEIKQEIKKEQERATHVYIGDSQYKVEQIMGEPKRKNRTVTSNGTREQWVYNNKYIYIENGVVVAFQD